MINGELRPVPAVAVSRLARHDGRLTKQPIETRGRGRRRASGAVQEGRMRLRHGWSVTLLVWLHVLCSCAIYLP